MFKKISKKTIAAQVITQLTELIRNGRLKPGDRMPSEREMAEELGVSRPPLRESLRALEYAGVIETRYGDGIYVKSAEFPLDNSLFFSRLLNHYSLEEMVEIRKIMEAAAVRFAIERSTDEDVASLDEILKRALKNIDDVEAFIAGDFDFHRTIVELTRNSLLLSTFHTMHTLMDEFNFELLGGREFRGNVLRSHAAILNGIRARDAGRAIAAMEDHLDNVLRLAERRPLDNTKTGDRRPLASRIGAPGERKPQIRRPASTMKSRKGILKNR